MPGEIKVQRFTGLSHPLIGFQRKEEGRITLMPGRPDTFRIECRNTDRGVSSAPTNRGCRAELNIKPKTTQLTPAGYAEAKRVLFYMELGGEGPTSTANWSARAQLHGPNRTGQATGFVCTPGGTWMVRLWDAGTQRQFGMFPVIDRNGRKRRYEPGERLGFAWEIVPSTDPAVGRVRLLVDGVEIVDRRFQTLHTRRLDGSAIGPGEQGLSVKAGLYMQAAEAPASTIATVGKLTKVTGPAADLDDLLAAVEGGPIIAAPQTTPVVVPAGPCAAVERELDETKDRLEAAEAEAASLAMAHEERVEELRTLLESLHGALGKLVGPDDEED